MGVTPLITTCEQTVTMFNTRHFKGRHILELYTRNMRARITVAIIESRKVLGIKPFRVKQVEAIDSFLSGRDTFVSLPTGYGKSVIYAALPPAFNN